MANPFRKIAMTSASQVQLRDAQIHQLANGMVLVGEPTDAVQSAALSLLVPCGYSTDPAGRLGLTSLLCDMIVRGAGTRDSRALINDLENLGVERASRLAFLKPASVRPLWRATWQRRWQSTPILSSDRSCRPTSSTPANWFACKNFAVSRTNRARN